MQSRRVQMSRSRIRARSRARVEHTRARAEEAELKYVATVYWPAGRFASVALRFDSGNSAHT